ncbi:class I mannose-6-phosphate isomerase [Qipengyuania zhejiangensis]|uniref:class I mannose-6-phosphate isomerase n=1 Tax=Qipengyuania zhejiangensis TaxID=3077782 RepID=UPI002D78B87D|nr:class I mannose-6-phosphate isomerase [Qipengyuania sp. Z2]
MIRKLARHTVEKVWGVEKLPEPFDHDSPERIGEVWFDPPPELQQLLVKFIFASERLSVQTHPDDAQARTMGLGTNGKSECWIIVDAAPDAVIAAGFKSAMAIEDVRSAAMDGSIVDRLVWHKVKRGDVFYIPAGTVHAIGGGVGLIEVQQNSDITFRLFDYGRPRELHLDAGLQVASCEPYADENRSRIDGDTGLLVDGPHFSLSFARCAGGRAVDLTDSQSTLIIPYAGTVRFGDEVLEVGDCAVTQQGSAVTLSGDGIALIAKPKIPPQDAS